MGILLFVTVFITVTAKNCDNIFVLLLDLLSGLLEFKEKFEPHQPYEILDPTLY